MIATVLPLPPLALPSSLNCWLSISGSDAEPGALFGNRATRAPVMPKYHLLSHPSGVIDHEKAGTFCWVRNCVGGTEVIEGTITATPSCCTSRWPSASAAAVFPCAYVWPETYVILRPFTPPLSFSSAKRALAPMSLPANCVSISPPTLISSLPMLAALPTRAVAVPVAAIMAPTSATHATTATKFRLLIRLFPPVSPPRRSPRDPATYFARIMYTSIGPARLRGRLFLQRADVDPLCVRVAAAVERADAHVVPGRCRPQRGDGRLLAGARGEGVERVPPHGVLVRDLRDVVRGGVAEHHAQLLRRVRPRRVGVGIVELPAHVVDPDAVAQLHPDGVVDEAREEVLAEDLARQLVAEVLSGPEVVELVRAVDALEEVGDPAGTPFRQRELDARELGEDLRPHDVGRALADDHGLQRHHHVDRRVGRGLHELAARAEVDRHDGLGLGDRGPEGIPRVGVEARVVEQRGVLGERHRVASLRRGAAHLRGGEHGIPKHGQRHRDEPVGIRAAPLVDVPVVVGLDDREREVLVGGGGEETSREAGERREVQRAEHAARVHVLHALVHVPAPAPHLLVRHGLDAVLLAGPAGDGVEAHVRHGLVVEHPDVVADVGVDDLRCAVAVALRDVGVEERGRLHEVVVDTHEDERVGLHGAMSFLVGVRQMRTTWPPSTAMVLPVSQAESSDRRNAMVPPRSSGVPRRLIAICASRPAWYSSGTISRVASVSTGPGAIALTRMFIGASSTARHAVRLFTAALATE